MKRHLTLALALATLSLRADPPAVVVTSLSSITVAGGSAMTVTDAIANHRDADTRAAIHDAVIAYDAAMIAAKAKAENDLTENLANQAEVVAAAKTALEGTGSAEAKLQAISAALAQAQQMRAERDAARLAKEADELAAQAAAKRAEAEALANP